MFFRFGETEHFILQQLDGASSPEMVRQRVEERFDAPLSPEAETGPDGRSALERMRTSGWAQFPASV